MKILNITVRITTLVVATILITTSCSKYKPPTESKPIAPEAKAKPPVLIEPNAGVDKVRKGMNKQQVEAELGKPDKINSKWWFYLHRGIIVAFGDNGVMFNIKCVSPFAGVTKEGIGIGSTRAELITAYGNPGQDQHFDHGDENLWFAPLGTSFYLENDKITSFIVHLDVR
jgi:hypothetical protein